MHRVLLAPERSAPTPARYRYRVSRLLQYETSTLGDTDAGTCCNVAKVGRFIRFDSAVMHPFATMEAWIPKPRNCPVPTNWRLTLDSKRKRPQWSPNTNMAQS